MYTTPLSSNMCKVFASRDPSLESLSKPREPTSRCQLQLFSDFFSIYDTGRPYRIESLLFPYNDEMKALEPSSNSFKKQGLHRF